MSKQTIRRLKFKTMSSSETPPQAGLIGRDVDTIIAKQVSDTEADLYVCDKNGKILGVKKSLPTPSSSIFMLLKDDLINAEGDESFTYDIVAKPDKTLGIIPKKANNTVFIQSINVNKGSNSIRGKFYYTLHINIPIISSVPFTIQSVKLIGYGFDRNEIDVTDNTNLTYNWGNNSLYSINMRTIDYDIDFGTGGWLMGLEFMFSVGGTTETYFRFFERAII